MTIAKRLSILLAVPLVALLGFGIFTRTQLSKIEQQSRFVAETQIGSLAAMGDLTRHFAELRVAVRNHLLATNQAAQEKARLAFEAEEVEVNRLLSQYADRLISDDPDRRMLDEYRDLCREYITRARTVLAISADGRRDEAAALLYGAMGESASRLSKVSSEWTSTTRTWPRVQARRSLRVSATSVGKCLPPISPLSFSRRCWAW